MRPSPNGRPFNSRDRMSSWLSLSLSSRRLASAIGNHRGNYLPMSVPPSKSRADSQRPVSPHVPEESGRGVVYPEEEEEEEVGRSHGQGRAEAEGSGSNRQEEEEAAAAFWGPFCSQLPDLPTLRVCTYLPTT
ncbi:hypothetical protein K0M31_005281 [Melipona bicolor]|uniref:Uncharacterized protein n=1 Tax=Melipona bicolor TaxID=60889 RepID=A0AA40KME5_9HYME|nr:hypothetical protein K0M31_005281 [Melipona bicolor]